MNNFSNSSMPSQLRSIHNFIKSLPGNIKLLISSRNQLNDTDFATNFEVSGLSSYDGVMLFLKLIESKQLKIPDQLFIKEVRKIVDVIEGHPLAIKLLAGSYFGGGMGELTSIHDNIINLRDNLEPSLKNRSLRSCFNYSFSRLSKKKKELLGDHLKWPLLI